MSVIVTMRIMPKDENVDISRLESEIKNTISPERIEREPIAFGVVALKVVKIIPEEEGSMEELEKNIKRVEGVGEVEVLEVTRSL